MSRVYVSTARDSRPNDFPAAHLLMIPSLCVLKKHRYEVNNASLSPSAPHRAALGNKNKITRREDGQPTDNLH